MYLWMTNLNMLPFCLHLYESCIISYTVCWRTTMLSLPLLQHTHLKHSLWDEPSPSYHSSYNHLFVINVILYCNHTFSYIPFRFREYITVATIPMVVAVIEMTFYNTKNGNHHHGLELSHPEIMYCYTYNTQSSNHHGWHVNQFSKKHLHLLICNGLPVGWRSHLQE